MLGDYRTTPAFGSPGFVTTIFFNLTHEIPRTRSLFGSTLPSSAFGGYGSDEMNEVFRDG